MKEVNTCDTGKLTFDRYQDAVEKIIHLQQKRRKDKFSVYKCHSCGKFHITTANKKNLQRANKRMNKYPIKIDGLKGAKKETYAYKQGSKPKPPANTPTLNPQKLLSPLQAEILKHIIDAGN